MYFHKNKIGKLASVLIAASIFLAVGGLAHAQDAAEDYYEGKTITIVVGFNPGGGYDEYARMIAPELEKRIGATVVVENQPGGGGLLALNRLAQSGNDRTMMLASAESAALAQLTDRPGTRFDLGKVTWLGRAVVDTRMAMWSAENPERSFDEALDTMKSEGSRWGATGLTDSVSDATAAMAEALNLTSDELSIVLGYDGTSAIALAVVRGEADGVVVSSTSAINYVGDDSLVPLAALDRERDPLFPDTPTIFEVGNLDDEGERWMDFRSNITTLGRALVMHGDVDKERSAFLASHIEDILTDEEFIQKAEEMNRPISYLSAAEQNELVQSIFSDLSDDRKAEIKQVLTEKYVR
jgi:putative tricarboxylic transport membrane protein